MSVPKLCDFAYVIQDEVKHSLAVEIIENFQSHVIPHLHELECGPIHGDFNEQNILGLITFNRAIHYFLMK